jgi:hypothetical protein
MLSSCGLADWAAYVPALLLVRMALIVAIVVATAIFAERIGPFFGGMVASLPIYAGPIYVVLALEHDVDYLYRATIGSVAICGATAVFVLAYCYLARSWGVVVSLAGSFAAWMLCVIVIQTRQWSLVEALVFVTAIFVVVLPNALRFTRGIAVQNAPRRWTDLPLRALLVAGVAGLVMTLSSRVPAQLTGILSVIPIILTSIIIVLQPRVGGPATAALLAHTLSGIIGMVLSFATANLTLHQLGAFPALGLGLVVAIAWNLMLIVARRMRYGR